MPSVSMNIKNNFRYTFINFDSNLIHILVPISAGIDISTDNTCKSEVELKSFFQGGACKELNDYKKMLEEHLSFLSENDDDYIKKKSRLDQVNLYLQVLNKMQNNYDNHIKNFLNNNPSNLYGIQLRPTAQDRFSKVVNPVFTINRKNDNLGNPLSQLYNKTHQLFPDYVERIKSEREKFINDVLNLLPKSTTLYDIQKKLQLHCNKRFGLDIDFENYFTETSNNVKIKQPITKEYIDDMMGFEGNASAKDYIEVFLGLCAGSLFKTINGSPFRLQIKGNNVEEKTESLAIMLQFFLGFFNVYCRAKNITNSNFGEILDKSPVLSQNLILVVSNALMAGRSVEKAIFMFFHLYEDSFKIQHGFSQKEFNEIIEKFENIYLTVTATNENPHMDDFKLVFNHNQNEKNIFISKNGLICTDLSYIISKTDLNLDKNYFEKVLNEAHMYDKFETPKSLEANFEINLQFLNVKLTPQQFKALPNEVKAILAPAGEQNSQASVANEIIILKDNQQVSEILTNTRDINTNRNEPNFSNQTRDITKNINRSNFSNHNGRGLDFKFQQTRNGSFLFQEKANLSIDVLIELEHTAVPANYRLQNN